MVSCSFSLFQFGNTCYCNSVLQALYFCRPFRESVLAYKAQQKKKENLLTCLADLFHSIATQKKKVGVIPPKKFISRLRKENGEEVYTFLFKLHHSFFWKVKCLPQVELNNWETYHNTYHESECPCVHQCWESWDTRDIVTDHVYTDSHVGIVGIISIHV